MKKGLRKNIFIALHLLGFLLLWWVVRNLEWEQFFALLGSIPLWKFFAGLLALCLVYALKSLRWYQLNRSFGIRTTWRSALVFYLAAGFLSVITPGRLGELAKIYFLKRKYGTDLTSATSSVILDRIWDVLILSIAGCISLLSLLSGSGNNALILTMVILLFLLSLGMVLLPSLFFSPALYLTRRLPELHKRLKEVLDLWKEGRSKNFLSSIVLTAAAFLILAALPLLFSAGSSAPIPFGHGIAAISVSNILSFLPVTVAGFGTRELVFTEVWKLQDYSQEIALTISTAYFLITYLGSLVIGGVVYLLHASQLYRPAEIRDMAKE
jgi:uncharacterized protein (TIRG00374 family)